VIRAFDSTRQDEKKSSLSNKKSTHHLSAEIFYTQKICKEKITVLPQKTLMKLHVWQVYRLNPYSLLEMSSQSIRSSDSRFNANLFRRFHGC